MATSNSSGVQPPGAEDAVVTTPEHIREAIGDLISRHWHPEHALTEWRQVLAGSGWAAPSWPTQWFGRGLPAWADEVAAAEILRLGAVGAPVGSGMSLAAPTILSHGSDAVRDRFLLPTLIGTETWCQLFSEPGAGSDLAGATTTAVLDGDEWVVNGQKVWNTSAHHADLGILVARTDWTVPKHRGLTYFVIPMRQPGVTVQPLRQMNGHSSFNEVFLTDARIPRDWVVGGVGGGWAAALTTLAHERRFGGMGRPRYATTAGRALDEAHEEADRHFATYSWYPQRAGRPDLLAERARAAGRHDDPVVRDEIARVITMQRIAGWTGERARQGRALGRPPGAEGSVGKLAMSDVARLAAHAHAAIAAADAMLGVPDADPVVAEVLISVPGQSIAGGTDEIQRNILGEQSLGLPREPAPDRDLAFRDTRRNS